MSAGRPDGVPILSIQNLQVEFRSGDEVVTAVNDVSYDVHRGETVGVVGESGSGKSVTVQTVLGLLPTPPARIRAGRVVYDGEKDLLTLSERALRRIRGKDISMVFQDPMSSLNPVMSVGRQLAEALRVHDDIGKDAARSRAVELLELVGIPDATSRAGQFPHQFSGGMRQRVMIAMAVANKPKLIIADEPTTALDVTIQAQVLEMLDAVRRETHAATILITHDLALVAEMCDWVVVMYGGKVVETGSVADVFDRPSHPYTVGLMQSLPRIDTDLDRLHPIPGSPPSLSALPTGCAFHPRCALGADTGCRSEAPVLVAVNGGHHAAACHFGPLDQVSTDADTSRAPGQVPDLTTWRRRA